MSSDEAVRGHRLFTPDELATASRCTPRSPGSWPGGSLATRASTSAPAGRSSTQAGRPPRLRARPAATACAAASSSREAGRAAPARRRSRARWPRREAGRRARGCGAAVARGGTCRPRGRHDSPRSRRRRRCRTRDDAAQGRRTRVEKRFPGVVLEPRDRAARRLVQCRSRGGRRRSSGCRRQRSRAGRAPRLGATTRRARGTRGRAAGSRRRRRAAPRHPRRRTDVVAARREVGGDHRLLPILTAADIEEVVRPARRRSRASRRRRRARDRGRPRGC